MRGYFNNYLSAFLAFLSLFVFAFLPNSPSQILCHYKCAMDKENEIILHLLYISKAMYVAWVILHREMICRIPKKKKKKERKGIHIISKGIA